MKTEFYLMLLTSSAKFKVKGLSSLARSDLFNLFQMLTGKLFDTEFDTEFSAGYYFIPEVLAKEIS
jgi:hypothetical protein